MQFQPDLKANWTRLNFDESKLEGLTNRQRSEIETNRDLIKPVEQLVCDVHEEIHDPNRTELQNIASSQKRMVSIMARLAKSDDRMIKQIGCLTWAIAIMTLVIVVFTILLWKHDLT
jgi:hypothetical protein